MWKLKRYLCNKRSNQSDCSLFRLNSAIYTINAKKFVFFTVSQREVLFIFVMPSRSRRGRWMLTGCNPSLPSVRSGLAAVAMDTGPGQSVWCRLRLSEKHRGQYWAHGCFLWDLSSLGISIPCQVEIFPTVGLPEENQKTKKNFQ